MVNVVSITALTCRKRSRSSELKLRIPRTQDYQDATSSDGREPKKQDSNTPIPRMPRFTTPHPLSAAKPNPVAYDRSVLNLKLVTNRVVVLTGSHPSFTTLLTRP